MNQGTYQSQSVEEADPGAAQPLTRLLEQLLVYLALVEFKHT